MKLRRLAIVIGIDRYPHPDERLHGCVGDARRFGLFLQSARGGTFDEVISLTDGEATLGNIRQWLSDAATQQWGQVVVYFAGHGAQEGILAWDELLYFSELAPAIMSIPAYWHLLVLDACHAGAVHDYFGFDGVGGVEKYAAVDAARVYLNLLRESHPGLRVITAVDRRSLSIERNAQGLFTTALLRAARLALPDLGPCGVSTGRVLSFARMILARQKAPMPQASGKLDDFPLAVTDLVRPLGSIAPRNIQLRWEQPDGGPLQACFEFSVDIHGRTLMPVWIQHELHDGMNHLNITDPTRVIPGNEPESLPYVVQVPAHWLPLGREVHSVVTVRDERKRVVGRHEGRYPPLALSPLRFP